MNGSSGSGGWVWESGFTGGTETREAVGIERRDAQMQSVINHIVLVFLPVDITTTGFSLD